MSKKDDGGDVCARPCDPRAGQERTGFVELSVEAELVEEEIVSVECEVTILRRGYR